MIVYRVFYALQYFISKAAVMPSAYCFTCRDRTRQLNSRTFGNRASGVCANCRRTATSVFLKGKSQRGKGGKIHWDYCDSCGRQTFNQHLSRSLPSGVDDSGTVLYPEQFGVCCIRCRKMKTVGVRSTATRPRN